MKYLLDSNICIFALRKTSVLVLQNIASRASADIGISAISVAELHYGTHRSNDPQKNRLALERFIVPFNILSFDYDATVVYGDLRARLEFAGTPIGSLDTLIAAHAKCLGLTLVTNNVREFSRVPGLVIEDWSQP